MFFIVILAHASINITLRMASINTNAVLEASKHLCKPSKSFDLQLRGQPHSGTTWLGKQVADIIYMASTYNPVGLRSYFYVHEGTDEPGMIACTYNISWREQAKHSIDGLDLQGPGLPQGIARGMDPRMVPCLHLEAEKLLEACVTALCCTNEAFVCDWNTLATHSSQPHQLMPKQRTPNAFVCEHERGVCHPHVQRGSRLTYPLGHMAIPVAHTCAASRANLFLVVRREPCVTMCESTELSGLQSWAGSILWAAGGGTHKAGHNCCGGRQQTGEQG